MSKLIELLRANGASDADIEQMKPLLDNAKFATAIEKEVTAKAEFEAKYGVNSLTYSSGTWAKSGKEVWRKSADLRFIYCQSGVTVSVWDTARIARGEAVAPSSAAVVDDL